MKKFEPMSDREMAIEKAVTLRTLKHILRADRNSMARAEKRQKGSGYRYTYLTRGGEDYIRNKIKKLERTIDKENE